MAVPVSSAEASGQPSWHKAAFLAGSLCTLCALCYFIWLSLESQSSVTRKFWRKVILHTGKLEPFLHCPTQEVSLCPFWIPTFSANIFFCLGMGGDFPWKKAGNVGIVMQHCCCLVQVLSQQRGFCNCKHRYLMPSYPDIPRYFSILWINFPLNKVNAMFCQIRLIPYCIFLSVNALQHGGQWEAICSSLHLPASPFKLWLLFL